MDPYEVRIFGVTMICLSTLFIVLQITFIKVCSKNCGYQSDFAFTLMCSISGFDCVQLIVHLFIGCILAFQLAVPSYISTIGAFMIAAWFSMVIATVLLTFHRLLYTVWPIQAKIIISQRISKLILMVVFISYGLFLVFHLSPYSAIHFDRDFIYWYYNLDTPYAWLSDMLDRISNYTSAIVTTLVYAVVFGFLFHRRSQIRKDREMRTTLLVFSFCAYQLICFIIWEFIMPEDETNLYISCVSLLMWVIWNGAGVVLYMALSVSFRRDLKKMFRSAGCCSSGEQFKTVLPARHMSTNFSQKNSRPNV